MCDYALYICHYALWIAHTAATATIVSGIKALCIVYQTLSQPLLVYRSLIQSIVSCPMLFVTFFILILF